MNKRFIDIINDLSNKSNNYTIDLLAKKYNVTTRTIRYDIQNINKLLDENNIGNIVISENKQIKIPVNFSECKYLLDLNDFYEYKLKKEERVLVIIIMLLMEDGFVTLSQIADKLCYSRTTIIKDLPDTRLYLKNYSLMLQSFPNKGLKIKGSEIHIRSIFIQMFQSNPELINHIMSQYEKKIDINEKMIRSILSEVETEYQIDFTDASFKLIVFYLKIIILRLSKNKKINRFNYLENKDYNFSKSLMLYISQYCNLNPNENEIAVLSTIIEKNTQYKSKIDDDRESIAIQIRTRKLIENVSRTLGINLTKDYQLYENLSTHLTSIYHKPLKEDGDNPVFEDVKETQKRMVDAVTQNIEIISSYFKHKITETEIIYIVIHFCAAIERKKGQQSSCNVIIVCNSGAGTSQFIAEKLKQSFHINIIDCITTRQLTKEKVKSADLIISTESIYEIDTPYIVISTKLSDTDYVTIRDYLFKFEKQKISSSQPDEQQITAANISNIIRPIIFGMANDHPDKVFKEINRAVRRFFNNSQQSQEELISPYLHHLLTPDFIQLDVECENWRDAIRKSAQSLLINGYIEKTYISSMIHIVEEYGPYFCLAPGFAIPHAGIDDGSYKIGMSLIRLKQPVEFGIPETDPIKYVITLSTADQKTHLKALFHLLNLIHNQDFINELDNAITPTQINKIIEQYEYSIDDY